MKNLPSTIKYSTAMFMAKDEVRPGRRRRPGLGGKARIQHKHNRSVIPRGYTFRSQKPDSTLNQEN
jgi:hypothetical protein